MMQNARTHTVYTRTKTHTHTHTPTHTHIITNTLIHAHSMGKCTPLFLPRITVHHFHQMENHLSDLELEPHLEIEIEKSCKTLEKATSQKQKKKTRNTK